MIKNYLYKNKYNLSYSDYGEEYKNTLILFHGLFGSARQDQLGKFFNKKNIRLICIARFGYGESSFYKLKNYLDSAKVISEFLTSLNIKKFNIFGISAGTPHAYALAFLNPKRASKVFIYSGISILYKKDVMETYPKDSQDFFQMSSKNDIKTIGKTLADIYEPFFTGELKKINEYKDTMINEYQGMGQEAKLQSINWGFEVEMIKQKIYLQHSKNDEIVPFEGVKKSINYLKNPVLIELEKEGHYDEKSFNNFTEFIYKNF